MAYSHKAGTDGTVTVPDGKKVLFYAAASESGGTITITQAGESAQEAIPVPAGGSFDFSFAPLLNVQKALLEEGSTLVFADTNEYIVVFA